MPSWSGSLLQTAGSFLFLKIVSLFVMIFFHSICPTLIRAGRGRMIEREERRGEERRGEGGGEGRRGHVCALCVYMYVLRSMNELKAESVIFPIVHS